MAVTSLKLVNLRCRKRSVVEFMQSIVFSSESTMSLQRKFTFAISSPDEFLVITCK